MPDPASRFQPWDVNGPSAVVDPCAFEWSDDAWRGRPWREAVIYEMHVGAFTPEGTYAAAQPRLADLAKLGVTAIELMPLADFAGRRNWGYDGVLPFAPDAAYGTPEDLKRFVAAAHGHGLMVLLDVVYNHFGPEGNYLARYAPQFFNPAHQTPWGAAINFDGEQSAHRARVLRAQRALLDRGIPPRRPAHGRDPRHRRRFAHPRRDRDRARGAPTGRGASAPCTSCSRTTATRRGCSNGTSGAPPRSGTTTGTTPRT